MFTLGPGRRNGVSKTEPWFSPAVGGRRELRFPAMISVSPIHPTTAQDDRYGELSSLCNDAGIAWPWDGDCLVSTPCRDDGERDAVSQTASVDAVAAAVGGRTSGMPAHGIDERVTSMTI